MMSLWRRWRNEQTPARQRRARWSRLRVRPGVETLEEHSLPSFLAAFTSAGSFPAGQQPVSVAVGDFNRDGRPDLVFGNPNENTATVLLNLPGGLVEPTGVARPPGFPGLMINVGDVLPLTRIDHRFAKAGRHAPPGHRRLMLTLTNVSGDTVQGPLFLLVRGLPRHGRLLHAAGSIHVPGTPVRARIPFGMLFPPNPIDGFRPGDSLMVALDFVGLQGRQPNLALGLQAGTPQAFPPSPL